MSKHLKSLNTRGVSGSCNLCNTNLKTMGVATVVSATLMLSGIIGLTIHYGNQTVSDNIPFEVTSPLQLNLQSASNETNDNLISNLESRGVRTLLLPPPDANSIKSYSFAQDGNCGPIKCTPSEQCVSWIEEKPAREGLGLYESVTISHLCLEKSDKPLYSLMDPGVRLCGLNKIPIFKHQSQNCLASNPPCPLVWRYKCVTEKESLQEVIHSCRYKKCPADDSCVDFIECGTQPPCFTKAVCVLRDAAIA